MSSCKNALAESNGDIDKAVEILREKGMKTVETRAGRKTSEGIVDAYIHSNQRLGVLIEVNCETDFVARNQDFKTFVRDIAMHIAAFNPKAISREDFDQFLIETELRIYREQMRNQGKPDKIIDKIAEGKLDKFLRDNCLLEQKFAKDSSITVQDLLNQLIAKTGENIRISRFKRLELGDE